MGINYGDVIYASTLKSYNDSFGPVSIGLSSPATTGYKNTVGVNKYSLYPHASGTAYAIASFHTNQAITSIKRISDGHTISADTGLTWGYDSSASYDTTWFIDHADGSYEYYLSVFVQVGISSAGAASGTSYLRQVADGGTAGYKLKLGNSDFNGWSSNTIITASAFNAGRVSSTG